MNIDLRALVERDGDERVRDNLLFSPFEFLLDAYVGLLRAPAGEHWKDVLYVPKPSAIPPTSFMVAVVAPTR